MKSLLKGVAYLISIAVAIYFIRFLSQTFHSADLEQLATKPVIMTLPLAALIYVAIIPISAWAWRQLLRGQGESWSTWQLSAIMGLTQIAKYVPGNIAQHVGRASLALGQGMKLKSFTASVVHEALLTIAASLTIGVALVDTLPGGTSVLSGIYGNFAMVAGAIAAAAGVFLAAGSSLMPKILREKPFVASFLERVGPAPGVSVTVSAFTAYCLNYLVVGYGIWLLANALGFSNIIGYAPLTAAFAMAWVLGFVTPGAPAGLGVREGVMALVLAGSMPGHDLLAIILASRLMTIIGDGMSFLLSAVTYRRLQSR